MLAESLRKRDELPGGGEDAASPAGFASSVELGAAIRDVRKKYMLTQKQLAE
ncbi:hypothetical protein GCM10007338_18800 [Corynebacterium pelargi]|nr:hypothetical protein GCM10007338_18800 [Corynebacterium pelargi]